MTDAALAENIQWRHGRRWVMLFLVLAGQVAMIFWLGNKKPAVTPSFLNAPQIFLSANPQADWPGLINPTQFILPHQHGFSGPAWLEIPAQKYDSPAWTDLVRPLALPTEKLGGALDEFLKTNVKDDFEFTAKPEPELPPVVPLMDLTSTQSTLTVAGEIADHPLLAPLKLDAWPANDILMNSDVEVTVDQDGKVFSAVLLAKSGSKDADNSALTLARLARFRPWRGAATGQLHWGQLIFHWQTIAPVAAKTPQANP